MKSKLAYAIVSKKRPRIDISDIYSAKDIEFIKKNAVLDSEMVVKVVISLKK